MNLHVVALQGPDGVDDLLHLVVDHAVQLTVPDSVSIHNDARGEAVVELVVFPERRWRYSTRLSVLVLLFLFYTVTCFNSKVNDCGTDHSRCSSVRP